jgi:hypothetical protein
MNIFFREYLILLGIAFFIASICGSLFEGTRNSCIFAALKPRVIFLTCLGVVFFIATNTAKAENSGYHSNGYYTDRSVIVSCMTEKGSLSSFNINNLNFSFMQLTKKNASKANNSTLTSTPAGAKSAAQSEAAHVSFKLSDKLFDKFTKFPESEKNAETGAVKDNKNGYSLGIYCETYNLYAYSLLLVLKRFINEEIKGQSFTESRLMEGIEAARTLFPNDKRELINNRNFVVMI